MYGTELHLPLPLAGCRRQPTTSNKHYRASHRAVPFYFAHLPALSSPQVWTPKNVNYSLRFTEPGRVTVLALHDFGPTLSPPALLPTSPIGSRLSLGRIGACPSSAPTPVPKRSRCWAPRADRQAPSPPLPEQLQIALQGLRTLLEVSAGFGQAPPLALALLDLPPQAR